MLNFIAKDRSNGESQQANGAVAAPRGFLAALALVAAGVGWIYLVAPAQAARRYLLATYFDAGTPRAVRVETLSRGLDRADLRVTAQFEKDPDYGTVEGAPPWLEYTAGVALVRRGLRWLPAHGGLITGDRTYAVFTWTATDPAREKVRGPSRSCG